MHYADDPALLAESEAEPLLKIKRWKDGMESKGLRMNMGKTKVMKCHSELRSERDTGLVGCVEKVWGATRSCALSVCAQEVAV